MSLKYEPCPKCRARGADSRGDNLVAYPDGGKHCFACGYHEQQTGWRPAAETGLKGDFLDKTVLPSDFTRQVDPAGWKWLSQYGLPISYWQNHCGYSPKEGRVVFPIPRQNPVFSVGRLVETDKFPEGSRWKAWGDKTQHAEIIGDVALSPITVVVEDLISAHKVGQVYTTLPLFGINASTAHLKALQRLSKPIVLWLDWDQRGLVAKKATRISLLTGLPVYVLHTRKDPKLLSVKEIEQCIGSLHIF